MENRKPQNCSSMFNVAQTFNHKAFPYRNPFTETGDSLLCSQELANLPILNLATLMHTYSLYLSINSLTAHSTAPLLFLCLISFSVLAPNIVFRLKTQIKDKGADKSLARPTSRCILFDGENISFDASLVLYI